MRGPRARFFSQDPSADVPHTCRYAQSSDGEDTLSSLSQCVLATRHFVSCKLLSCKCQRCVVWSTVCQSNIVQKNNASEGKTNNRHFADNEMCHSSLGRAILQAKPMFPVHLRRTVASQFFLRFWWPGAALIRCGCVRVLGKIFRRRGNDHV